MQVFITFYCVVAELERYMCVVGWRHRGGCTETFGPLLYIKYRVSKVYERIE